MIGKLIAAAIGKRLDERDGSSGLKGAAIGVLAAGAIRRFGPLGLILGGAWIAKQALDKRKADRV